MTNTDRLVVLDTETTGLDAKSDRLIEIGVVEIIDRRLTGQTFYTRINPERSIDWGASEIHGIYDADVQNEPLFCDIAKDFLAFVGDSPVLAHNAAFDVAFLDQELARIESGITMASRGEVVDTLQISRKQFPGQRQSLDALCDRLGVIRSHRKFHGALLDANLLAEVYLAMTRGQSKLTLQVDQDGTRRSQFIERLGCADRPLPVLAPTEEEKAAHIDRMKSIAKKSGKQVMDLDPAM